MTFTVSDGTAERLGGRDDHGGRSERAPVLAAIGTKSVDELATLTFTVSATDVDLPANTLTLQRHGLAGGGQLRPGHAGVPLDAEEAQGRAATT